MSANAQPIKHQPTFIDVTISEIDPSKTNPRRFFDETLLNELAESIKQEGVLEPVLLRLKPDGAGRYELIAGERRWRSAMKAELTSIPAIIREMTDDQVLNAQIHENLHRADVHPMDEAFGYQHLLKVVDGLSVEELARRVGKSAKYVAQRLSLTTLIEPAVKDFMDGLITLGHATQISRLSPEVQPFALNACYPHENVMTNTKTREWESVPVKEAGAHTVADLSAWINQNLNLDLKKAPWSLEDATLVPEQGACSNCQFNTATNQLLFGDAAASATCTNALGYNRKMMAVIEKQRQKFIADGHAEVLFLTDIYHIDQNDIKRWELPEGALSRNDYEVIVKKKDRCGFARPGIYVASEKRGHTDWVCIEPTCKDHKGRYNRSSSSSSHSTSKETPEGRGRRKQELFDVRVNEPVRQRVFKEALPLITWPLSREAFNRVAFEFFKRIPSHDQRTICDAFGWDDKLRYASDNKLPRSKLTGY